MSERAIVYIGIFLAIQLGSLIWFLATMKSELRHLNENVRKVIANYVSKMYLSEKLKRLWDHIDLLKCDIDELKNELKELKDDHGHQE